MPAVLPEFNLKKLTAGEVKKKLTSRNYFCFWDFAFLRKWNTVQFVSSITFPITPTIFHFLLSFIH